MYYIQLLIFQWWTLVKTVRNLRVSYKTGLFRLTDFPLLF